jgi:hypothetical protein
MHTLDAEWFAPVLAALGEGRIQAVTLVLGGENHFAEFTVTRRPAQVLARPGHARRLARPAVRPGHGRLSRTH